MTSVAYIPTRAGVLSMMRPKSSGGTVYYAIPGVSLNNTTASSTTGNTDFYMPFFVATPVVVDQLALEVATLEAGTNARMGLYAADRDCQPWGPPLADSGDISMATTGVKTYAPSTPIYLEPGRYLTVYNHSGTGTATLRGTTAVIPMTGMNTTLNGASIREMSVARAYAAFPSPGTKWDTVTTGTGTFRCLVFLRLSAP